MLRVSKHAALLQAFCVRAARGAATVRAKNGALREELGAVIFELRRTKVFRRVRPQTHGLRHDPGGQSLSRHKLRGEVEE